MYYCWYSYNLKQLLVSLTKRSSKYVKTFYLQLLTRPLTRQGALAYFQFHYFLHSKLLKQSDEVLNPVFFLRFIRPCLFWYEYWNLRRSYRHNAPKKQNKTLTCCQSGKKIWLITQKSPHWRFRLNFSSDQVYRHDSNTKRNWMV